MTEGPRCHKNSGVKRDQMRAVQFQEIGIHSINPMLHKQALGRLESSCKRKTHWRWVKDERQCTNEYSQKEETALFFHFYINSFLSSYESKLHHMEKCIIFEVWRIIFRIILLLFPPSDLFTFIRGLNVNLFSQSLGKVIAYNPSIKKIGVESQFTNPNLAGISIARHLPPVEIIRDKILIVALIIEALSECAYENIWAITTSKKKSLNFTRPSRPNPWYLGFSSQDKSNRSPYLAISIICNKKF